MKSICTKYKTIRFSGFQKCFLCVFMSTLTCFILICDSPHPAFSADKPNVFVSIPPQKYFVRQIGRNLVDIQVMVQPGASPATYEPKPQQMVALAKAQLFCAIGVPYEKVWLKKIADTNPTLRIIYTDTGINKIAMGADHHHANEKTVPSPMNNREQSPDPHIWLAPNLVKRQALNILAGLKIISPEHSTEFEKNYSAFIEKLNNLDQELKRIFSESQKMQFLTFHPSWGYFAKAYGLKQLAIEIEGKSPKSSQLKEIIAYAQKHRIKVIFAQPQFSSKSAATIAREIGGQIIIADPLAAEWDVNIRKVAAQFKQALR